MFLGNAMSDNTKVRHVKDAEMMEKCRKWNGIMGNVCVKFFSLCFPKFG